MRLPWGILAAMQAACDPARGIVLDLPVTMMNAEGALEAARVEVVIDQRDGDVRARLQ